MIGSLAWSRCPAVPPSILTGLRPSQRGSVHREVANRDWIRLLPDDGALAWISKKPCGAIISVIRTTID